MRYTGRRDAVYAWVETFNAFPISVIEKISRLDDSVWEITPKKVGDYVRITDGEHYGECGEIIRVDMDPENENDLRIRLDGGAGEIDIARFFVEDANMKDFFPAWGTMWQLPAMDQDWAEKHLQEIADCGFRIFHSQDLEIIIGIDGGGYDFYEHHWIPPYIARGLKWSDEDLQGVNENE